jgi:hypothetical protein
MKHSIKLLKGLIVATVVFTSCEKKIEPIENTFSVNVEFRNSGFNYLTSNIEINPKDSIFFDFSVTAGEEMKVIEIQKNGVKIDTFNVSGAAKTSFSGVKKYQADSIPGDYTYRVIARNVQNVFIGDGNKAIKVSVKSDFNFWSYRFLQVPDSSAKTNTCYMATTTGNVYSYTTGAVNSSAIDFGFYFDTTGTLTPVTTDDLKFSIYSLSSPQTQLNFYDISSWTKNVTIMKKATTPSFANLTSGGALRSAGIANLSSGTTNKVTALAVGNLVFFKTTTGKVGCLEVRFGNGNGPEKDSYINVDVKIEK